MLPPDVSGQLGGQPSSSLSNIGSQLGRDAGQEGLAPGSKFDKAPNAALPEMLSTVEKVLGHMARMNPKLQPFVERAMDLLKKGVEQVSGGSATSPNSPDQSFMSPAVGAGASLPDNESSMSFPA